tara:strand:+ start:5886 stop:6569 length:684 start_codon:yes stop_codon:yes gene_type:complete
MPLSKISTNQMADDSVTNAKIGAGAITNTEVNASAAIASSKLGTLAASNMPGGSILQAVHHLDTDSTTYAASSSALGHDILNYELTTKKANSTFFVAYYINHGVAGIAANMDSHDIHFLCMRTASGTHAYIGGNSTLTRNTANAPTNGKLYCTDVPFSPSRGATYGNGYDTYHRSGSLLDSPGLAAGVTNRYRIRMFNQAAQPINRGRNGLDNAGGTSSLFIMEIAT